MTREEARCKTCIKHQDPYCAAGPVWHHIADPDHHWCASGAWLVAIESMDDPIIEYAMGDFMKVPWVDLRK